MGERALESDEREFTIENRRRPSKKPKKKNHFGLFIVVFLIIASAAAVYFAVSSTNGEKISEGISSGVSGFFEKEEKETSLDDETLPIYESESSIKFEPTSRSVFADGEKGFYHFTKDGTKFYDMSLNHVWNSTYTMSSVFSVSNNGKTVLAETQGRKLKMYTSDGEVYSLNTDGIIMDVFVGETGEISMIMRCNDEYRVQVYSARGEILFERYEQDDDIYPVKTALSSDGRVLAVSYMDAGGVEVESKILLFYKDRNDTKNSETGDFFAAVEKKGQIVPLADHSGGNFIFVGDKEIFSLTDEGKDGFTFELGNKIERATFTNDGKTVIAMGDEFSGKDGKESGTVVFYDASGNEKTSYNMGRKVTYLKSYEEGIVAGAGKEYVYMNNDGRVLWTYKANRDVSDIIPLEGNDILVVTSDEAMLVDIKKYQKQQAETK